MITAIFLIVLSAIGIYIINRKAQPKEDKDPLDKGRCESSTQWSYITVCAGCLEPLSHHDMVYSQVCPSCGKDTSPVSWDAWKLQNRKIFLDGKWITQKKLHQELVWFVEENEALYYHPHGSSHTKEPWTLGSYYQNKGVKLTPCSKMQQDCELMNLYHRHIAS